MLSETPMLSETIARYELSVPDAALEPLDQYCRLVWDWNEKLNLTRHTDYEKFVTRDLVDSLQLSQLLSEQEKILDVGSGGGVPGMVLAILRPELKISLCESIGKKAEVLKSIARSLKLSVPVIHARAEDVLKDRRFDTLTARAVGPLWKMLKWFAPHWTVIGRLLTIKGPRWVEERGEARHRGFLKDIGLRRVAEYTTPGSGALNVILQLSAHDDAED